MAHRISKLIAVISLLLLIFINCIVAVNYYFIKKIDLPVFFILQTDISPQNKNVKK